jgi:histidinol phosphatase-like enzyme (inositol monophosphatase family)
MNASELTSRLEFALAAAREAGQIACAYFGAEGLAVERKSDLSPVTVADREAELHLRKRIGEKFPHDGILGEEFAEEPGTSGYRWILDPIDGTKSFISGVPLWGCLVAVERGERGVVGVIHMPALDETAYAAVGHGAWHVVRAGAPRQAHVGKQARLEEGLFCTSEGALFEKTSRGAALARLERMAWLTRTWGDCYGYLLVASGRAAAMVDPQMHVWDCAALAPILEEAGGTFTDWSGRPTIHGGEAVATNGLVAEQVLAITREYA